MEYPKNRPHNEGIEMLGLWTHIEIRREGEER